MKQLYPREVMARQTMVETESCYEGVKETCTKDCPYRKILSLLGKRYTFSILRILAFDGVLRFNTIAKRVCVITKTVTERLNELVTYGVVKREAFAEIPPRVEYSLTEMGLGLKPTLSYIREWGEKWNLYDC